MGLNVVIMIAPDQAEQHASGQMAYLRTAEELV